MVDLDAYFTRIGYDGPRTPELATLRALHALHPAAIPFENLDVLLGRGVSLEPAAIDAKLIGAGRGGYCFEQNALFGRVLTALGFRWRGLLGRVVWMAPPDAPPPPRTHMAILVEVEGETWLADVGFGGAVLSAPLRWRMDEPQATPHESFRLRAQANGDTLLETKLEDWTPVYHLQADRPQPIDYEVANWYTSTHPASRFRQVLMAARTVPGARYALLNNRLTVRKTGEAAERRTLMVEELEEVLADLIGLPVSADWRPALERVVAAGA